MSAMRIVRAGGHAQVPWKNGLGVSGVIATEPSGAGYDALDWQVATTGFASEGPFSALTGLERRFMLLEGDGVELTCERADGQAVSTLRVDAPFVVHQFSGDWKTWCRMLGGPVRVLNVITRRGRFSSEVEVVPLDGRSVAEQKPGETLIALVLQGRARIAGIEPGLSALDALRLDAPEGARVALPAEGAAGRLALVRLRPA